MMIEKLFKKHTEGIGIDTIVESDANFEQTMQIKQADRLNTYGNNFDANPSYYNKHASLTDADQNPIYT